jgi:hypothetical protein
MAVTKDATAAKGRSQARAPRPKKGATAAKGASKGKSREDAAAREARAKRLARLAKLKGEYALYKSLEERHKVVERARRAVFAHLMEVTFGNIELAGNGNYSAGKLLLEFAGIDELPALEQASPEPAAKADAPAVSETKTESPAEAVLAFYKRLGLNPPKLKKQAQPETAASQPAASDEAST